jgi:hypothetical protein
MEILKLDDKTFAMNRGGRPKKSNKKDCFIGVRCTMEEKKLISGKAEDLNQRPGEYLRNMGLNKQFDIRTKTLPKEILQFVGTLNHLSANVNQLAKKGNMDHSFRVFDVARLIVLAGEVKELAIRIKTYLK